MSEWVGACVGERGEVSSGEVRWGEMRVRVR